MRLRVTQRGTSSLAVAEAAMTSLLTAEPELRRVAQLGPARQDRTQARSSSSPCGVSSTVLATVANPRLHLRKLRP